MIAVAGETCSPPPLQRRWGPSPECTAPSGTSAQLFRRTGAATRRGRSPAISSSPALHTHLSSTVCHNVARQAPSVAYACYDRRLAANCGVPPLSDAMPVRAIVCAAGAGPLALRRCGTSLFQRPPAALRSAHARYFGRGVGGGRLQEKEGPRESPVGGNRHGAAEGGAPGGPRS